MIGIRRVLEVELRALGGPVPRSLCSLHRYLLLVLTSPMSLTWFLRKLFLFKLRLLFVLTIER
jgi:hypothetical protein